MNLVQEVYKVVHDFPSDEKFGLSSQIKRSAISIPSNIAEGAGRNSNKDFNRFLAISSGSSFELQTQLALAHRLSFLSKEDLEALELKIEYINNKNYKLRESLHKNIVNEPEADNYKEPQS